MLRYIYIIAGTICVIIGTIGAFVPLLPTTPLLLLAAWLYIRSSDRLYNWLLNQKILGPYIRVFMEENCSTCYDVGFNAILHSLHCRTNMAEISSRNSNNSNFSIYNIIQVKIKKNTKKGLHQNLTQPLVITL